ncbi:MAG: DNA cytosine methyltransferase [Ignavibacteriales bacterium]|nr:DNA cytosine methyltransferase [Ignavibacteriales bacterium]
MIRIFSFFSGLGFLDLGFEKAGFKVDFVNEIHTPFLDAYKYARTQLNIPTPEFGYSNCSIEEVFEGKRKEHLIDSINKISGNDISGFIGGPPCPDFSVAGKNKGKLGDNGKLSGSYINAIKTFKPDFFLFENVKGLWKTAKHRAFYEELKSELSNDGYILTENLINAIQFGAPQDRERILLFGLHKDAAGKLGINFHSKSMKFEFGAFDWNLNARYPNKSAFQHLWPDTDDFNEDSVLLKPKNIIEELTVQYWFENNNVSNHPNAQNYFQPRAGLEKFQVIREGDVAKKSYKRLHRWRYSPTVAYGNNEVHLHPYKSRRISVAEALALQSMPKNFTLPAGMSLTNMFKGIGNGVPFLAALNIAKTIKDFLRS